ncbi:hypothetical protein FMM05_10545 [Flavobacterium zepuense]|uniref:Uncharacterized protein n=1 Tax=Flavobacterium zepuense TaxID=2593302 RepID=A0A552V1D1_9FLAO|nr:hypothetical protein [Flavobacterium zepuense]TRW24265.1 hypothetical protein FMM05_10545 [Flavobacterium zepuense]
MKRQVLLIAAACCLFSCDYIMKSQEQKDSEAKTAKKVVIGNDKDEMGCVKSAGYRWSYITKECIRPIEEGYRLNSIAQLEGESSLQSVFVLFEEDGDRAELFFPNQGKSLLLKKDSKNGPYKDAHWQLQSNKGYKLIKDGQLLYAGAAVQEGQITGDDKEES